MSRIEPRSGMVVWITGFSGSGKTTVAHLLADRLRAHDIRPIMLDGDTMRAIFGREAGFGSGARLELARSYARLCKELADQGFPVICATISMFNEVRAWNRTNIPLYYEVYLRVPVSERTARDAKGLYASTGGKERGKMVGLDMPAEEPQFPDLIIDNWGTISSADAAAEIWQRSPKA